MNSSNKVREILTLFCRTLWFCRTLLGLPFLLLPSGQLVATNLCEEQDRYLHEFLQIIVSKTFFVESSVFALHVMLKGPSPLCNRGSFSFEFRSAKWQTVCGKQTHLGSCKYSVCLGSAFMILLRLRDLTCIRHRNGLTRALKCLHNMLKGQGQNKLRF